MEAFAILLCGYFFLHSHHGRHATNECHCVLISYSIFRFECAFVENIIKNVQKSSTEDPEFQIHWYELVPIAYFSHGTRKYVHIVLKCRIVFFSPLPSSLKYPVLPSFVFVRTEWNNVENYNCKWRKPTNENRLFVNEKRKFSNVSTPVRNLLR